MSASAGRRIGPYRVIRSLGSGATAQVFEVRRDGSPASAALKLLDPQLVGTEGLARFLREAQLLGQVQHTNVVRVLDAGAAPEGRYLVTEQVVGEGLGALLKRAPCSPQRAAELTAALAGAVAALHAAGILHRDLKPENVVLREDGVPILLDFGLAREVDGEQLTRTGAVLGTPAYMSPEQAKALSPSELDGRADVYGLGAILFTLLAGRAPFTGRSIVALLRQVITEDPRWPSLDRPEVPAELEAVCKVAMAKDRADRYGSVRELKDDVERFLRGEAVEATGRVPQPKAARARAAERSTPPQVLTAPPTFDGPTSSVLSSSAPTAHGEASPVALVQDGRRIGGWTVVGELGRGGMGVVFRVRDAAGEEHALKVLLDANPRRRQRFEREAEVMRFVGRHSHVVSLRELGDHQGNPYLVMDLVRDGTLGEWVGAERLDLRAGALALAKVADALHFAHEAGVVHRDLKPGNVLMTAAGEPLVTDFGLAKDIQDEGEGLTKTGDLLGTIAYMAPEQARRSSDIDRRVDVYALGVMLYELACGELPFAGPPMSVLAAIIDAEPDSPRAIDPTVPAALEAVCLKAIAKSPDDRYQTAAELGGDLRRWANGEPVTARLLTWPERALAFAQQHRGLVLLLVAVVVGVLLSALLGKRMHDLRSSEVARGELRAGLAAIASGDSSGEGLVQAAAERAPDLAEAWVELAVLAADRGDLADARQHLGRARDSRHFLPDARTDDVDGRLAEDAGDLERARDAYVAAIRGGRPRLEVRLALVQARRFADGSATAEAYRWKALRANPRAIQPLREIVRARLAAADVGGLIRGWEEVYRQLGGASLASLVERASARETHALLDPAPGGDVFALTRGDYARVRGWLSGDDREAVRAAVALAVYPRGQTRVDLEAVERDEAHSRLAREAARATLLGFALPVDGSSAFAALCARARAAAAPTDAAIVFTLLEQSCRLGPDDLPSLESLSAASSEWVRAAGALAIAIGATRAGGWPPAAGLAALESGAEDESSELAKGVYRTAAAALRIVQRQPAADEGAIARRGALLACALADLELHPLVGDLLPVLRHTSAQARDALLEEEPTAELLVARAWSRLARGERAGALADAEQARGLTTGHLGAIELVGQLNAARGGAVRDELGAAEATDPVATARARRRIRFAARYHAPAAPAPNGASRALLVFAGSDPLTGESAGLTTRGTPAAPGPHGMTVVGGGRFDLPFAFSGCSSMVVDGAFVRPSVWLTFGEPDGSNLAAGYQGSYHNGGAQIENGGTMERRTPGSPPARSIALTLTRHEAHLRLDRGSPETTPLVATPHRARTRQRVLILQEAGQTVRSIQVTGYWDPEAPVPAPPPQRRLRSLPGDAPLRARFPQRIQPVPRTLGELARGVDLVTNGAWVQKKRDGTALVFAPIVGDFRFGARLSGGLVKYESVGIAVVSVVGEDFARVQLCGESYYALQPPAVAFLTARDSRWYDVLGSTPWSPTDPVFVQLERRGDFLMASYGSSPESLRPLLKPVAFPLFGQVELHVFAAGAGPKGPLRVADVVVEVEDR